jgi:hypothetical protein
MLLFKPYHVFPIVCPLLPIICEEQANPKTETRRAWTKPRAKVGSVHQCKLNFYDPCFAKVEIRDVYEQPLGEMTKCAALREGGYTLDEYKRLWQIINKEPLNPLEEVFVVEMRCVEVNISSADLVRYGSMYRNHMQALRSEA